MIKKNFFFKKSKGEVLVDLKKYNLKFKIPKTTIFFTKQWKIEKNKIYSEIKKKFTKTKLAIRSSSRDEDLYNQSSAGKYLSILNVNINNKKKFFSSINRIIKSYSQISNLNNQIIVQEMVTEINSSGVAFTKDIENGSDYYVINYDDVTGKTNTVTSGQGHYSNRILYIYKKFNNQVKSKRFKKLIECIRDLEKKIELDSLDIEFAINNKLEIYLLQARPISTANKWKKKK